jgi:hypothetical protein
LSQSLTSRRALSKWLPTTRCRRCDSALSVSVALNSYPITCLRHRLWCGSRSDNIAKSASAHSC